MVAASHLRVEEIIEALTELGGEAEWNDIKVRVTEKRGRSYVPYKDWRNFRNTMFQLLQQHCEGYRKFAGPVLFEKGRKGRFRLVPSISPSSPRTSIPVEAIHPETVPPNRKYIAGAVCQVFVNAYERDPIARMACLERHGTRCAICAMSFEQRYGAIGRGFIHVHHKKSLASREVYHLEPLNDLVPVCPNCHSMLHSSDPPLTIEELREEMRRANPSMQPTALSRGQC